MTTTEGLATRYLGHCQICEGEFKLHEDRMVHHGYRRPGYGSIIGDCIGVAELPYELSCELVKTYLEDVRASLTLLFEELRLLEAGEVTEITEMTFRKEPKVVKKNDVDEGAWKRAVDRKASTLNYQIGVHEREIVRLTARIASWKLSEVRTVLEAVEQERLAKAERDAVRNEKREARMAKERAKRERAAALSAKRQAIKDEIFAKVRAFAKVPGTDKEMAKLRTALRNAHWIRYTELLTIKGELTQIGFMRNGSLLY